MRSYDAVVDCRGASSIRTSFPAGSSTGPTSRWTAGCARGAATPAPCGGKGDDGATLTLAYAQLKARVDAAAGAMRGRAVGSLLCGSIHLPSKPASSTGPTLGVHADVVEEGQPARGEIGELVVRSVWPGMTEAFRRGEERYREAYRRRFPGIWHQGDRAYVDADGYWHLLGRCDDTTEVAGKRLGAAEVGSLLVADDRVLEAPRSASPTRSRVRCWSASSSCTRARTPMRPCRRCGTS